MQGCAIDFLGLTALREGLRQAKVREPKGMRWWSPGAKHLKRRLDRLRPLKNGGEPSNRVTATAPQRKAA
jgi:hypothetical protein